MAEWTQEKEPVIERLNFESCLAYKCLLLFLTYLVQDPKQHRPPCFKRLRAGGSFLKIICYNIKLLKSYLLIIIKGSLAID